MAMLFVYLFFTFFVLLLIGAILHHLWTRVRTMPRSSGGRDSLGNQDPRVALAAMMYTVASIAGRISGEKRQQMVSLLAATLGLSPDAARTCLASGQRLSRRLHGDLNSRLHQLQEPIQRKCSAQEKQDAVDLLHAAAGRSAERVPSLRASLGRISGSLLHD